MLINEVSESDIDTACRAKMLRAVVMVVGGDEPNTKKGKDVVQIIAYGEVIAAKSGEVLYDDALKLSPAKHGKHTLKLKLVPVYPSSLYSP